MDTLETLNCPACGKEMKKINIPSKGIHIDICLDGCGGIFFDNREFDKFNEATEDISEIENLYKSREYTPVNDKVQRKCPACGGIMVKNKTSPKSNIEVDDCYMCGGKFLDYVELEKIRSEFATDKERSKATLDYFLSNANGEQINDRNEAIAKIKMSPLQRMFYSLLDINDV